MRTTTLPLALLATAWLAGCDPADDTDGTDGGDTSAPEVTILASCDYINTFSSADECKEYTGAGWTLDQAGTDCDSPFIGADPGTLNEGLTCDYDSILGRCVIDEGEDLEVQLVFPGDDPAACDGAATGCGFGGGTFVPSELCEGGGGGGGGGLPVFRPFEQVCAEPLAGEDPGTGPDGDVCTWEAISACTEEGRDYLDYASCDPVFTQRPYAPSPAPYDTPSDDPRLSDTAYMAELDWVTQQVESCACICCHSSEAAPDGASDWYLEAGELWVDTLDDDGLAMMAGWVDSTSFGAFPPEDNNGFDRSTTGMPTTDVARMQAFLEGELARRGLTEDDFTETEPFGGPLYDQIVFEPGPCENGEGVSSDGTLTWAGGDARYVYVLEADADNPAVPPNLDLPEGTLWRIDVDPDDDPIESTITYGTVPSGAFQFFPETGAPAALADGTEYYLVALKDIYQPRTRCLFTYPAD